MTMKKRISLILSLVMLLGVGAVPIAAEETVTVTFDLNGGTSRDKLDVTLPKGGTLSKDDFPNAELENKVLFDWFTTKKQSASTRVTTSTIFETDTTVYAVWDDPVERRTDVPNIKFKTLDKAYISFIFDDNNTDLKDFYEIITGEYGYPICAAVPAKSLEGGKNAELLQNIQAHGGEIVAHGYSHKVLNRGVLWSEADFEFAKSKEVFESFGLNVNGVVTAGGGGTEDISEAYKKELEGITAKYYDYGTWAYGAKRQYYSERYSVTSSQNIQTLENVLNRMINNKEWVQFTAHNTSEFPLPLLREFMEVLKAKEEAGLVEVITYKTAYETLAEWDVMPDFGDTTYTVDLYFQNGVEIGESVTVCGETPTLPDMILPRGKKIAGFNTNADGSGNGFKADLSDVVVTNNMKLYAILGTDATVSQSKLPFDDVSEDAWYYDDLKYAYEKKLFNGVSETSFAPETTLNRAMFVTVLHRMNFEPEAKTTAFRDVPTDAYFAKAVCWASENKIVNGVDNFTFAPENVITREQLATIIYRYVTGRGAGGTVTDNKLAEYKDGDQVSGYAVEAMNFALEKGLICERADGTIAPRVGATRAEAATALVRMLAVFGE